MVTRAISYLYTFFCFFMFDLLSLADASGNFFQNGKRDYFCGKNAGLPFNPTFGRVIAFLGDGLVPLKTQLALVIRKHRLFVFSDAWEEICKKKTVE